MKHYFLFGLLVLTSIFSAHAQKLSFGGRPKLFESKDGIKAYEVKLPDGTLVRKLDRKTGDAPKAIFEISKGRNALGEIPASVSMHASIDNFFAFYGDLDKNGLAELVVVDFEGQSMGLGVSTYTINIFPDYETKGFQAPITFNTTEFGSGGTFVYQAKTNETLILLTEFSELANLSPKIGTYFVGRFFRYQNGRIRPATDKPIYVRRYLYSFESERWRTEKNPLRPWLWLNSSKTNKLRIDPELSGNPVSSQTGVVEKFEIVTEKGNDGGQPVEVKIEQLILKLDSGETQTLVIRRTPEDVSVESDKQKIFADTFGLLPDNISLPLGLDLKIVLGNPEGKKVVVKSYWPFEFDDDKKPRYKVLFYE